MATNMKLWQVEGTALHEIPQTMLDDELRLEEWIVKDAGVLDLNIILIGRQVTTVNRGRVDLIAIDGDANLVVLELKRDKTPREVVAQALDYASWVKDLSYAQIESMAQEFLGHPLPQAFREYFGYPLPKQINTSHSIIVLASELDDSSERIVQYLSDDHGVPINVLFFRFFKSAKGEFLGRAWLQDPEELREHTQSRKQTPWSGYYFVNVGESEHRNWDDCRKYGFLTAGQGEKAGKAMKKLNPGDLVFAYMKGLGYVGHGVVTKQAVMVRDFIPDGYSQRLLDLPLTQPGMSANKDSSTMCEWVVAVKWKETFSRDKAKKYTGIFANQNIVCGLYDVETTTFLKKEFSVE